MNVEEINDANSGDLHLHQGKFRRLLYKSLLDAGRLLGPLLQFPSEPAIAGARRGAIEET